MNFTLLHPSRGRPDKAEQTMYKWVASFSGHDLQYILSIDSDDPYRSVYESKFKCEKTVNRNGNVVDAVQSGVPLIKNECVIVVSDDFDCPPGWDVILKNAIGDKKIYAVYINDGYSFGKRVMTLPIVSKTFIDQTGYIYFPGYTGMFADNDLFEMAEKMGIILTVDTLFQHNHYCNGKSEMDATYMRHNTKKSWQHGERLLAQRRRINFGLNIPDLTKGKMYID